MPIPVNTFKAALKAGQVQIAYGWVCAIPTAPNCWLAPVSTGC
jgi:hypothetical protein